MKVHYRLVIKQFSSAEHNIDPPVQKVWHNDKVGISQSAQADFEETVIYNSKF